MFNRRKNTQKRVMTGLLGAVGAVGAFFGVRALMSWLRQRDYEQEYRLGYDTGMEDDSAGSVFPANLGAQPERMPVGGVTATGRSEVGENYENRFSGESETQAIPATGVTGAPVEERARSTEREWTGRSETGPEVTTTQPIAVGSLVGPLIVHLLTFHNMINLIKQRRENMTNTASDRNAPDVRAGGADAISSLEAQIPEFDHAALVQGSLQARMIQLMDRMRDALQNTDYSEDQLFKISDELRPAVCKVLDLIHKAGQDNVTGFEDMQKAYQCR